MAHLVFRKTPAGAAELQSHQSSLPRPLRSLLIVVNGTTPARTLMNQAKALALPESALADLVRRGLIEPVIAIDPQIDPNDTGAFARPGGDPLQRTLMQLRSLDLARSYAAAYMRDFSGDGSDTFIELFAAAKTIQAFLAIVENCAQIIANVDGVEAAARFVRRVHRLLPPEPPKVKGGDARS